MRNHLIKSQSVWSRKNSEDVQGLVGGSLQVEWAHLWEVERNCDAVASL